MLFSLIEKRRSIRKFKSMPIEKQKIDKLIEAALRSPSSRGFNPWRFIVVDRPELLESLSKAKLHGSSFLKDAPIGFVVCADENKTDVWVEDSSIATIFIQLAAQALGLGSCWIQIRNREHDQNMSAESYIKNLLGIPDNFKVESMIAIGYPDEDKKSHSKESLEMEKVFWNGFKK
ncbi:MAG: nitroreductase family protein [Desulfamplus sp.]|nr:nitroreductase family protein [Desulfamplus sp.]